jgi:hypothetical protein
LAENGIEVIWGFRGIDLYCNALNTYCRIEEEALDILRLPLRAAMNLFIPADQRDTWFRREYGTYLWPNRIVQRPNPLNNVSRADALKALRRLLALSREGFRQIKRERSVMEGIVA